MLERAWARVRAALRGRRTRRSLALAVLAAALVVATTRVTLKGRWYGLYLLRSERGRPFELKDDLRIGDGPRVLWKLSFAGLRDHSVTDDRVPHLELDWDAEDGGGEIVSVLGDGVRVETYFGRYVDDQGRSPSGLFVGGASPDVAATPEQDESGMALHDASGWHHVWCTVNEGLLHHADGRVLMPGDWTFLGSEVLVRAPERVVLHSAHELAVGATRLRMDRYAHFRAGRPYFRLEIDLRNVGDAPATISYVYGDEPWVGRFGSSDGNVGWTEAGIVPVVAFVDPVRARWGGILDTRTGLANFIAWSESPPDDAYFANRAAAPPPAELGHALGSNEVAIGLEWRRRTLDPGARLPILLTLGVAARTEAGLPTLPPHALGNR